jgi:hypothetical protein
MFTDVLYEFTASLTIMFVNEEEDVRCYLGQEFMSRCKKVIFAPSVEEALAKQSQETIDLVILNIDRFGKEASYLIAEMLKKDIEQKILISAWQFNDPSIVMTLVNLGAVGFVNKSLPITESFSLLTRVFAQAHDRSLLVHYVQTLEEQIVEALYIPCRADCPRAPVFSRHLRPAPIPENDEFEFFPTPPTSCSAVVSTPTVEKAMYKDYFKFLMLDDREELHDQLSDIDTLLFNAFGEDHIADVQYICVLGDAIARFGNILMHYQFFSDTGICIIELGQNISEKCTIVAEKSGDFEPLLSGFCSVLQTFIAQVWDKEAEDPKFFNDSIINDAQMITTMITPPAISVSSDNDDLIFF